MKRRLSLVLLPALLSIAAARASRSQSAYARPIMDGISNRGANPGEPYVTGGDRAYLIGTENGDFPDLGEHLPGEMGGLWVHPIKVIDGFWATVTDLESLREVALSKATEFVNYPYGGRFIYAGGLDSMRVERVQFSPDGRSGVIVRYEFVNASARRRRLSVQLSVKTDLEPVWYSEHLGIHDAPDTVAWKPAERIFVARDTRHPWFAVWGAAERADARFVPRPEPVRTRGMGATAASRYALTVAPHGTSALTFVFAASPTDERSARETYAYLVQNHAALLEEKKRHYAAVIDRARITIPDRRLQEVYNWVKVNTETLVRDVPGMGRGLGGGLLEYPWWFPDMYSLQALTANGDFELAKANLRLLSTWSRKHNGNGRIVHELTTNGAVVNPGNTQETAQFVSTVGFVVDWTGDLAFAKEMYPAMKAGLGWLLTDMDTNEDLFPEGYGIMEVTGLNAELIDVAVYTQQALEATARVARLLGDGAAAAHYETLAAELKTRINERFWSAADSSYGDFYGTRAQAISAAQGAIRQIRLGKTLTHRDTVAIAYYERLGASFARMPDTTRAWLTNKNWVIATPMEIGIAPRDRALRALDKIRREDVGEYGPYLSAVERGAMMTIATGVEAEAEARYGRIDQALWYMGKIEDTFNRRSPGTISEMMPDYGCVIISWTSYGIMFPLVHDIFGIRPDAVGKTVVLDPHMPTSWNDMRIDDLPIGGTRISLAGARTSRGIEYEVTARDDGWSFVLVPSAAPGARYYLNGREVAAGSSGIRMSGRTNRVTVVQ